MWNLWASLTRLHYYSRLLPHVFHEVSSAAGNRFAGWKSSPVKYATGNNAACVNVSGMPSNADVSFSYLRCNVVHALPIPRARRANINDHAAGRIEPYIPA